MFELTIRKSGREHRIRFHKPTLLDQLLKEAGVAVPRPCGGRGLCGKCAVELSGQVSPPNARERELQKRLCCQAVILGDARVSLPEEGKMQVERESWMEIKPKSPMPGRLGAAVDLGTTTIAVKAYDLISGACIGSAAGTNPQVSEAGDVMGRIDAAMNGRLPALQTQAEEGIRSLLECALPGEGPDGLIITGNTTMLYLLCGLSPQSLGAAPFQADTLFGLETRLFQAKAYLPPCMNAFVGADITCAVLASGMCQSPEISLLCDLGTNGEIALWKGGELYVTSTAAGPAFEGARISCGCPSLAGAIDGVEVKNGTLQIHTIGQASPVGVCGSGLIDAVAAGLALGLIDETGAMEHGLRLTDSLSLTQGDIRAVQLAKAAVAAGIETLLEAAGVSPGKVDTIYIAGGFGSHLNIDSARAIGLVPRALAGKVKVLGNAALAGASRLLLDQESQTELRRIAQLSTHVNLGGNPQFNDRYVENMLFEADETAGNSRL